MFILPQYLLFRNLQKDFHRVGSAKVIHSIQNYLNAFAEILSEKNRAEYEAYREELDKSRKVYANELASLYQQTLEIERAGLIEWNKAYNKLQNKFTDFQNEFINRWNATTAKWQEAVEGFEEEKTQWINAMFMEAESRSLAGLESGSGQSSASSALKAARDKVSALDSFDYSGLEKTSLVNSVLSDSKISAIETLLNNKASSIEQTKSPAFMLKASTEYQLYQAAQSVAQIFEQTNKRAEEISSRASAQRFRIEIDAKIKESIQKIDDKNTEMKTSFDERAFGEGYTVKNGYYRKKIVKDVSVFSVDTENVKVRMWKDFEANDPEVNLSLLEENVDAVSFSVIMTLVSAQLTDWENSIFGVSGLAATGDDKASTKTVSYIVGEFEKYAYGEQYKGEVELGKGLVGKILLDFENNSQKERAGWEALDAPTWERKLWCSDTFPGPSIREFSTMVASIAATVCTFGAGAVLAVAVSAAVMAANELTFELADVSVGYHDWDEAAKNVAKAAVSGAITGAASSLSGVASQVGGMGGVFLKTGITSSSSITTQFTNAFIDGGFSGVKDAFNSWSDWQGIAFSTAGSFVTNGLGAMNSFDSTGKLLNGNTFNTGAMSSFNSLAGGLTTNALEFAFTGQTTFNLANLSMLGLEYGSMWGAGGTGTISGGFLSMTVGQNGTHFAISSAGTDISLGTLKLAAAGAKESSKVIDWKYGSVETNSTLNSINMLGYTNIGGNQKLSKDIWNEKISVNYTDTGGDYGNYSGGSTINISSTLLGGGAEDYAKLATVLAHEGTHAYGNRIEGLAHSVGLETYTQINQAYDISGDIDFAAEMIEAIKDINSWKENTGDVDHWKMTWGGQLISDGDGWLKDMNGNYILDENGNKIGAEKQESGLLNIMAGTSGQKYDSFTDEQKQQVQELMKNAGLYMDKNGQWNTASGKKIDMNQIMAISGDTIAEAVFNQYYNNKVDSELSTAWGLDLKFGENTANKIVPELAQERYSDLITTHLLETDSPAALMNKYTWTIYDSNGVATQFYKIDENNPFLDDLLGQHDFKGEKGTAEYTIDKWGCNFMSQLAVPQLLSGNIFSTDTILSIWNNSLSNGYVTGGTGVLAGNVNSPEGLANYSFTHANISNYGMSVGHSPWWNKISYTSVTNIMNVGGHFVLGNLNNSIIYNPGYHGSLPYKYYNEVMLFGK